jgi:hypothetical protein
MTEPYNLWVSEEGRRGILLEMEEILSGLEACNRLLRKWKKR